MIDFSYKNESAKMVVMRCTGPGNYFLERVLFPSELFTFLAPEDSLVEIWGSQFNSPTLETRIRVKAKGTKNLLVA